MDYPLFLYVIWMVMVLLIVIVSRMAARKMKKKGVTAPRNPGFTTHRTVRDDDCAYGEANHEYSHQDDRRLQQLQGYLKAGLIDQKEYREMVARYRRQEQFYDRQ